MTTLLQAIAESYPSQTSPSSSSNETETHAPHPIDLPHTSRLYKTLLQGGHFNHTSKTIESSPAWDAGVFAVRFVGVVGAGGDEGEGEQIKAMCCKGERNGTFLVAELCAALIKAMGSEENSDTNVSVHEARQKLKSWLYTSPVQKEIEEGEAKGKKVLLENIGKL
ncbi:hypothetical protein BT96DRAFT_563255 [Gymnopus androsaceus JB14]|uniref:Uncharacterized protein n=1 Tax=Gymnopus androsaceus JB14 TaxID=1447944 RepID=A0A6A4HUS4_9AGAR|nr:hypothetical protein BT96DRAFT_563255 [Gymnopus androsaceus JB14]